ncbi:MAG: hypothetical protein COB78_05750 [Hyphomicrobiales bacterium]|nr:MAG: hypothetical protein COB78_05750 [Hyphomicrobiales bacterium]
MGIEQDALELPPEAAIRFLQEKINVPTKHWRQVYGAAHSHSFMVAGAATEALVEDFRSEIKKALEDGTTLEEFRAGFDNIVKKHGWEYTGDRNWRTRIIFETNLRSAHAAGRYHELTKPETLLSFPYWQYNHSGSNHPRINHLSWDGDVYRADAPFWQTNYPPNGWGCGCFVTPVSDAGLERQGKTGPDTPPNLEQLGTDVPLGVDPGFEWNPGQRWLTGGRPGQKIATVKQVAAFALRALDGELPVAATVPIANVPASLAARLELPKKSSVRLSVQTIRDHAGKHDVTIDDYINQVRPALDDVVIRSRDRISAKVEIRGKPFIAGFKVTRFNEFLMVTLRKASPRQIRQIAELKRLGN